MNQQEYPPVAVYKLNRRLLNLHVRDVNARVAGIRGIGQA